MPRLQRRFYDFSANSTTTVKTVFSNFNINLALVIAINIGELLITHLSKVTLKKLKGLRSENNLAKIQQELKKRIKKKEKQDCLLFFIRYLAVQP